MTTPTILIPGKFDATAKRIWTGVATQDELLALGETEVLAIKSDCEHMRIRYVPTAGGRASKAAGGKGGGSDSEATRSVDHVASDETPDRMGDIIRVAGWDLANFKSNPMLLWMHDHNHPIGRVTSAKKGKSEAGMRALLTTSRIHEDEKSIGGLSNDVLYNLVRDGDLPAVSVGFQPLASHRPESEDERVKLGLGPWGVVYEASDLLELSVVSIGANPNALKRSLESAVAAKRLAERDFDAVLAEIAKAFDAPSRVRTVHALGGLEVAARRALARAGVDMDGDGAELIPAPAPTPAALEPEPTPDVPDASDVQLDALPVAKDADGTSADVRSDATPPADPAAPTPAKPDPTERLAALVEQLDASLRANASTQSKLSDALVTLSTRLEEISRAAGAAPAQPKAAAGGGSPAGAGPSPESRVKNSGEFYAAVLEQAVNAVREGFAKKN